MEHAGTHALIVSLVLGGHLPFKCLALFVQNMGELTDQAHDLALLPRLERLECLLLGFLRRQRVALGKLHTFFGQSHNLVLTTALGKLQRRKPSRPKRLDRRIDGLFAVEPFTRQPTHGNASARCTRVDEHPVGAVRKTAGARELRIDTVKPVEHPVEIDQANCTIHLSHHSIVRVLTNLYLYISPSFDYRQ